MIDYDIFGARMTTVQGCKLAAVGLCRRDNREECEERLASLAGLCFDTKDPTQIDMIIAEKLTELYRGKALAVGATVYIESISNLVYRTGGVLGRPELETEDADSKLEELDSNLWMYTVSGGPGWIGFFPRSTAERLAQDTFNHSVVYPAKVNDIYRTLMRLSPEGYLFVSDGTGYDSFGLCTAKLGEKELSFLV